MALDRVRFERKVDRSGEHHLWLGAVATNGIGQVRVDGKLVTAPRVAYELEHGPLATGFRVLTCPDEPRCVRVAHLRVLRGEKPSHFQTLWLDALPEGSPTSAPLGALGVELFEDAAVLEDQVLSGSGSSKCDPGSTMRTSAPRW